MEEIKNLIAIHGAVDRALKGSPARRTDVSRLVPLYARMPESGWFDDFEAWTRERRPSGSEEPPFPTIDQALERLAQTSPPTPRMLARRLWTIAVAQQAFPGLRRRQGKRADLARSALVFDPGLVDATERADQLLAVLGDVADLPPGGGDPAALDAWWDRVLEHTAGLVPDATPIGPRPCSGRLVDVEVRGQTALAAGLETRFQTDALTFDRAIGFLEPSNWPSCNPFWVEMTETGQTGDVHHYHEVVSTDRDHPEAAWTVSCDLDFTFRRRDGLAITDYQLSHPPPQPTDDVLVDEGTLIVRRLGAAADAPVEVTTTKRVRFNGPLSGEALAIVMCATGYAAVAEDLVFSCAIPGGGTGTPFPAAGRGRLRTGAPVDVGSGFKALADEAGAALKACAEDWGDAVQTSARKAAAGDYTADDLVRDMAGAWARVLRDGATAVTMGLRAAQAATPEDPHAGEPEA